MENQKWYALTDSDWSWDTTDADDGAPIIVLATGPRDAVARAMNRLKENGRMDFDGIQWKIAEVNTVALSSVTVNLVDSHWSIENTQALAAPLPPSQDLREVRGVLRPFAAAAQHFDFARNPEATFIWAVNGGDPDKMPPRISVQDLMNARAALSRLGGSNDATE